jgi:hypothetical protein
MCAADKELSASPSLARLITSARFASYTASKGSPTANTCRGTVENAAATASDVIASSRRSSPTIAARNEEASSTPESRTVVMRLPYLSGVCRFPHQLRRGEAECGGSVIAFDDVFMEGCEGGSRTAFRAVNVS